MKSNLSLEEMSIIGERLYHEKYKETLEKEFMGQYVVIDVEREQYQIDPDRLVAIEKAKEHFGEDKIFYIVQIGSSQHPSLNYAERKYAWNF